MSDSQDFPLLQRFASYLQSGIPMDKATELIGGYESQSPMVKYLLNISAASGGGVAKEMERTAELVQVREKLLKRIAVAHASPKATARLVTWLPLLTLVLAQLIGWDVIEAAINAPLAFVSIFLGLSLLLFSKLITGRLLDKAKPHDSMTGFYLIGVALICSAGTSIHKAQQLAGEIFVATFGYEPNPAETEELSKAVQLVEETGAKASELIRQQAKSLQEAELLGAEIKIEKLGVKLMLPLGLGVLPSFVLLAIVPLMITSLGPK